MVAMLSSMGLVSGWDIRTIRAETYTVRNDELNYRPIGHIENSVDKPVKPDEITAVESRIVLDRELIPGLKGLQAGDRILVLFDFHLGREFDASLPDFEHLQQHPRKDLTRPRRGVFALRSPLRPNSIGATEVDIESIEDNVLIVHGLDAINDTPLLDIKPIRRASKD